MEQKNALLLFEFFVFKLFETKTNSSKKKESVDFVVQIFLYKLLLIRSNFIPSYQIMFFTSRKHLPYILKFPIYQIFIFVYSTPLCFFFFFLSSLQIHIQNLI